MLYTLKRRFARSYSIYAINLEWGCPSSPPITHTAFHNVLAANEAAHLLKSLSDDYRALFGPPKVSLRHRAKRVHPNPNHRGCPPCTPDERLPFRWLAFGALSVQWMFATCGGQTLIRIMQQQLRRPITAAFDCPLMGGDNVLRQTCVNRTDALRMIA